MLLPQVLLKGVDSVVASGQGFPRFLSFLEPPLFVFYVFLALLHGLRRIGPGWSGGLFLGRLCFFGPRLLGAGLFCSCLLGLYL